MTYYVKFRYTLLPDHLDDIKSFNGYFLRNYLNIFKAEYITIGLEKMNKLGEETHPHIHVHFTTDVKIGAIRTALSRFWQTDENDKRKGLAKYSLKEEEDVIEKNRFFRYAWKQSRDYPSLEKLPDNFMISEELKCAQEEFQQLVLANRSKMEKTLDKSTTYSKLCVYLETVTPKDLGHLVSSVSEFYLKEGMAMNAATIAGYVTTYAINNGILEKDKFDKKILSLVML